MKNITDLKLLLKKRDPFTHKGDYGKILVIAGSNLMTGALILASKASLRTGSGLVYASCTNEMVQTIHIAVPEVVCTLRVDKIDFNKYDAILIGPGMGNNEDTAKMLSYVLENYKGKIVIDADAINVISRYNMYEQIRNYENDIVLTPHKGEALRLLNEEDNPNLIDSLVNLTGKVICLKGHNTIVKDKEDSYINDTGNPGMATAGSGDVLSGIITSLLGQGIDAFDAASLGVYIHGLAGDFARDKYGEDGLIASDILEQLPFAIKKLKEI